MESIPFQHNADSYTAHAAGAITGATFVKPSSTSGVDNNFGVVVATAAGPSCGVAAQDCASGGTVTIWASKGGIYEVTVGTGGLTAGQEVEIATGGLAVALASGKAVGICMADTTAGNKAPIRI